MICLQTFATCNPTEWGPWLDKILPKRQIWRIEKSFSDKYGFHTLACAMCRRSDLSTISEQLQMMSASNANWCKCWSWFYAQLNQDALSQTHANTNVNTNANTSTNTNAGHDSVLKMPGPRVISYCCASPRRPVPLTLPSVRDGKRPVGGFPSEPLTITMHQPRPRCLKIQEGAASDGGLIRTRESRNACVPPTKPTPTHACVCVHL